MSDTFNRYSNYYDLFNLEKDYKAEAGYLHELIRRYKPNVWDILELGIGSGQHAEFLSAIGYTFTGIERSPEMVAIARHKNIRGVEVQEANLNDFQLSKRFEVAMANFHVVSYLTTNAEILQSFKNINLHLEENGIFIFDVWYSPAVLNQMPENRSKTVEYQDQNFTRTAVPAMRWNENIVDVQYTIKVEDLEDNLIRTFEELHRMRHFSLPEIDLLAKHTGFEMVSAAEFLTKKELGPDTWSAGFILRKITSPLPWHLR